MSGFCEVNDLIFFLFLNCPILLTLFRKVIFKLLSICCWTHAYIYDITTKEKMDRKNNEKPSKD